MKLFVWSNISLISLFLGTETPCLTEKSTFYGSSGANFPNQCQKDGHEIQVWPLRLLHVTSNKFRSLLDIGAKPGHQHLPWKLTAGVGGRGAWAALLLGPLAVPFGVSPITTLP